MNYKNNFLICSLFVLLLVGCGGKDADWKGVTSLYKEATAASKAKKYDEADKKYKAALKAVNSFIKKYPDDKKAKTWKTLIETGISTNSGFKNLD